ncbi:HNH endonuclease [Gordonia phage GMA2]|uniref:HNH domain-containing protein n=1 Tax=Gordonia phage GMA2 TaxID=1647283 RepID=A0A0K0N793_9CAUD|nr:HNH endonuclease [Gordonia phage GMA2]AKJ72612.1 hypothetical protein GMA2_74 [Gordonia phage GMA2]
MKTKETLHNELDALLSIGPDDDSSRVGPSIIGHCLIELGLVTAIECGWEDCIYDDREFVRDASVRNGGKLWISIDHVIPRFQGGSDRPENLMLLHFGCNSSKGVRDFHDDPGKKKEHSEGLKRRWKDPEYRERLRRSLAASQNSEKTREKRSDSMRKHWSDPERKKKHSQAMQKSWDTRKAKERETRNNSTKSES